MCRDLSWIYRYFIKDITILYENFIEDMKNSLKIGSYREFIGDVEIL
jgi:hypothetical protein